MKQRLHRGFTVVEIIIVLGIIGLLAAVVIGTVGTARQKARDTAQKTQLQQMQLALRAYAEANDHYPLPADIDGECQAGSAGSGPTARTLFSSAQADGCAEGYIAGLVPTYISKLPSHEDSNAPYCTYLYIAADDGSSYKLFAQRCAEYDELVLGDQFYRCPSAIGTCSISQQYPDSYAVYTSGAEGW